MHSTYLYLPMAVMLPQIALPALVYFYRRVPQTGARDFVLAVSAGLACAGPLLMLVAQATGGGFAFLSGPAGAVTALLVAAMPPWRRRAPAASVVRVISIAAALVSLAAMALMLDYMIPRHN